jgi:desulfoferrodoxin (superoxide reductase-like protein)
MNTYNLYFKSESSRKIILKKRRISMIRFTNIFIAVSIVFLFVFPVFADKTSVEIDAPSAVKKGDTITIKIKVTHNGNNFMHHTSWVYVKAGGKEIGRWEYSMTNLPENENFTKEVTYTVTEPVELEAEGNCNIHGSAGKKTLKISVK